MSEVNLDSFSRWLDRLGCIPPDDIIIGPHVGTTSRLHQLQELCQSRVVCKSKARVGRNVRSRGSLAAFEGAGHVAACCVAPYHEAACHVAACHEAACEAACHVAACHVRCMSCGCMSCALHVMWLHVRLHVMWLHVMRLHVRLHVMWLHACHVAAR
jgi:hypothetical protein